jgi:hypothetical protein
MKGYSKKALDTLKYAMSRGLDIEDVWLRRRHEFGNSKSKKRS